jgi:hypothetical protein
VQFTIKKEIFARNRSRSRKSDIESAGSVVKKITGILLLIFFTPAIVVSNFFAKRLILLITNAYLSLVFLAIFFHRIIKKETHLADAIFTFAGIIGATITGIFLAPMIPTGLGGVFAGLTILNSIATCLNVFFMAKKIVYPVLLRIISIPLRTCGFNISITEVIYRDLDINNDSYATSRLLTGDKTKEKLKPFNNRLQYYARKINDYTNRFFGEARHAKDIKALNEDAVKLSIYGEKSGTFILRKRDFKKIKIKKLSAAIKEIEKKPNIETMKKYIDIGETNNLDNDKTMAAATKLLEDETMRQKAKLKELNDCFPKDEKESRSLSLNQ